MSTVEVVDVIDTKGNITGEVKTKEACHKLGYWHKTVHVWFLNSKNEILMRRRSVKTENHPGKWSFCTVAHVDCGEEPKDAVMRECKTELGIKVEKHEPIFLFSLKRQAIRNEDCYMNNELNDIYLIKKDVPMSRITLNTQVLSDVKWVPVDMLRDWVRQKKEDLLIYDEEVEKVFKYLSSRT